MEPIQNSQRRLPTGLVLAALAALPAAVQAHGFVGQRFFPASIATEDPFVADELSLPTVTSTRSNADDANPATRTTSVGIDFSKRVTPDFGLSFGARHLRIAPDGQPLARGWDNIGLGAKYQLYRDDDRESIVSVGVDWDVGGSGSKSVGAERFSTVTPTVYFGKGFGTLPPMLRPLQVTGTVGVAIPSRASSDEGPNPHVLQLGWALEYNLPYLQSAVKDVGLRGAWARLVPLVEFTMAKPLDRVDDRRFTGTVNPGVLWAGRKVQVGLEAVLPMNGRSGHGVGFIAQLHFFLDDVFPATIGRPLFGARP